MAVNAASTQKKRATTEKERSNQCARVQPSTIRVSEYQMSQTHR
jgi:hypothetical protein